MITASLPSWITFNLAIITVALLYGVWTSLLLYGRVRSGISRVFFIFMASCWILVSPINVVNELDSQTRDEALLSELQRSKQQTLSAHNEIEQLNAQLAHLSSVAKESHTALSFSGADWQQIDGDLNAGVFSDEFVPDLEQEDLLPGQELVFAASIDGPSNASLESSELVLKGEGSPADVLNFLNGTKKDFLRPIQEVDDQLKDIQGELNNLHVDLRSVRALIVQENQEMQSAVLDTFKSSKYDLNKTTVDIATQMDNVSKDMSTLKDDLNNISQSVVFQVNALKDNDKYMSKIWLEYTECLRQLSFWDYILFKRKDCDNQHELNLSKL